MTDTGIRPYRVEVGDAELADLRERLARTRWPGEVAGAGWARGVPVGWLRELVAYWRDGYDWPAWQARLNAVPQFSTAIDGATVHFLHVRSPRPDALPLLLTHGWPGSLVEFERGGHFAALERPDEFVADARAFFRKVRERRPPATPAVSGTAG